jgi:uncharacterized protein (DUF1697 family)
MTGARSGGGARRQTWVALLRGVNLGARNKVSMARLRELFEELGHDDVATYVQSGNVLFHSATPRDKLITTIQSGIRDQFGLDITVLLRTKSELRAAVTGNTFANRQRDPTKLHVTFLAETPLRGRVAALRKQRFEPDEFRVVRSVVYLHCPHGYGKSKLSNALFEKELGVAATTRNWRTVTTLAELANS